MKERILIAEDDPLTRKLLESTLDNLGYEVISTVNGLEALREVKNNVFDAIPLLKDGADDYVVKPFLGEELHFRIQKNLRKRTQERIMQKIEEEKALLDLEHRKLVNWRSLYASKDIRQTEQMMQLLSRSINQSGGFMWLDLLKDQRTKVEKDKVLIDPEIVDLIISSTDAQKKVFDYLTFLGNLKYLELETKNYRLTEGLESIYKLVDTYVEELGIKTGRNLSIQALPLLGSGTITFDSNLFGKCIKYSPKGGEIRVGFLVDTNSQGTFLEISITNPPISLQRWDEDGEPIQGIPYGYSELVFDPFYTLEGYPTYLDGEDWVDGTGLYLCRQILKKHQGWISASNGIDYTGDLPTVFVRITMALPIFHK